MNSRFTIRQNEEGTWCDFVYAPHCVLGRQILCSEKGLLFGLRDGAIYDVEISKTRMRGSRLLKIHRGRLRVVEGGWKYWLSKKRFCWPETLRWYFMGKTGCNIFFRGFMLMLGLNIHKDDWTCIRGKFYITIHEQT